MIAAIPLGDIVQLRKGKKAAKVVDEPMTGALPYIQIDEVRGRLPLSFAIDPKAVEVGISDLCIVWDGANAGTVGYGVKGAIGSTVARMRLKQPDRWDTEFLGRLLQGRFRQLNDQAQARGATIPHVDKGKLEAIEVPQVDVSEQKRIAAILKKADAVRLKREKALKLADEFLRSAFLDMFGDPVTNPRGYRQIPLGEIIKVSSGNGLTARMMDPEGKYPVYGGNGINGCHAEYMFEEPQIVIGRVGVYCGAVHVSKPKSWITDNALYVKEFKIPINRTYLEWALRFANLNQYAGRAAQPLISGSRIYPVEIVVPDDNEQAKFECVVHQHEVLVASLRSALAKANDLFGSLAQRAFHGEL